MHDVPYLKGGTGPEVTAMMSVIGRAVKQAVGVPCGVQILAGANREAVAAALAAGLDFVRVEGYAFAHVADEGIIEHNIELPKIEGDYTPHDPIRIDSNADFDQAHGVVNWDTGNGTEWNPWIIENYDINGTGYGYCIYIGNTTDYFVLQDCYLHGASGLNMHPYFSESGLIFFNVQNGYVTDIVSSYNEDSGIQTYNSISNTISNNTASFNHSIQ